MSNSTWRVLIYISFIAMLLPVLSQADDFQKVASFPWSASESGIRYDDLPEGRYGPQDFTIIDDKIIILDNQNRKLKLFSDRELFKSIDVPQGCFNFSSFGNGFAVHDGLTIWEIAENRRSPIYQSEIRKPVRKISSEMANSLIIRESNGNVLTFTPGQKLPIEKTASGHPALSTVVKNGNHGAKVNWNSDHTSTSFHIDFPGDDLASIQIVGTDDQNNMFILVEKFVQHVPLKITRELRRYDASGTLSKRISLPVKGYVYIENDLEIGKDGTVYHLFSTEKGIEILGWNLDQTETIDFEYPDSYYRFDTSSTFDRMQNQHSSHSITAVKDFPQVTPDEALETGDSYVQLVWDCTSANITNGIIKDSYGNYVETPSWVSVGTHQRVPYKWGGFQTIDQFENGIANNKYAGDRYTSKNTGTPSAVGVDCSGFVSRCWKLPSHYSTRMMDDDITLPYDTWEQTRPGDAAHIVGHVRLIVEHNPNGTITMVEAAGYNWRVSYKAYSYAALSSYTPRYYINMQGTPGNIPQPELSYVMTGDPPEIKWQIGGSDVIAGLKLSEADQAMNWTEDFSVDKNSNVFHPASEENICNFFKLSSVSSRDSSTESLPSDVYGYYSNKEYPEVLIVDGFDRTNATSGSWNHVYHDFAAVYGMDLFSLGIPFETASNDAVIDGMIDLTDYATVVWFVGDESTADETLNGTEQNLVENYLKHGGNLLISGSEIAWDLDHKGSIADQNFFRDYLKAEYSEDDSKSYTVNGATGTPFENIIVHYDNGTHGIYEEDYPDVLNTKGGSSEALRYANGKTAAVFYEGIFQGGTQTGRIFYMGFPYETIYETEERRALLSSIMYYFEMDVTNINDHITSPEGSFELIGNYPNPFNNRTTIQYRTFSTAEMEIEVFNALGQLVYQDRFAANTGAGRYTLSAEKWSSGVYYYTMQYGSGQIKSGKLVLIK